MDLESVIGAIRNLPEDSRLLGVMEIFDEARKDNISKTDRADLDLFVHREYSNFKSADPSTWSKEFMHAATWRLSRITDSVVFTASVYASIAPEAASTGEKEFADEIIQTAHNLIDEACIEVIGDGSRYANVANMRKVLLGMKDKLEIASAKSEVAHVSYGILDKLSEMERSLKSNCHNLRYALDSRKLSSQDIIMRIAEQAVGMMKHVASSYSNMILDIKGPAESYSRGPCYTYYQPVIISSLELGEEIIESATRFALQFYSAGLKIDTEMNIVKEVCATAMNIIGYNSPAIAPPKKEIDL